MRFATHSLRCSVFAASTLAISAAGILRSQDAGASPADLLRPPGIQVEGVPALPTSLLEGLSRYQDLRGARFVDWAGGGGMLVLTRAGDVEQLHLVAAPGAAPQQLTVETEPVEAARALPDGRVLFSRGRGGDENFQVLRLDPRSSTETLLSDGRSRNLLGEVHPDGRRVAFTSTRRNGRDADVLLLDSGEGGEPKPLREVAEETWHVSDWSPDGRRAVLLRTISHSESYALLLDLETRTETPLPGETPDLAGPQRAQGVARADYRFGPGQKTLFFLSDARGEFRELVRLDLDSGKALWLSGSLPWDVEDLAVSPDRRRAAFTVNAEGFTRLFLLEDLAAEMPALREVDLDPCIAANLRFSPDGKALGFSLGRPTAPSEAHSLDVASGKLERWTESARQGFAEGDFARPELFRYTSFDGRGVPAFAYVPQRRPDGGLPVLISVHGGPEGQHRPSFSGSAQFLVRELGLCVIAPNVRGSTGYGKTYALLDNGRLREDSVRDLGGLLDWIEKDGRERWGLDPGRVAVSGGSYGGYMVLAALVRYGERLRAGIDAVGISDFASFLENTSPYRRQLRRAEYGDERDPEMRRFFAEIAPRRNISKLRSALFVIHGRNDPRVPISEALEVVAGARAAAQPVWTLFAANEGHGFERRENRDYEEAARALFLNRYLLGTELAKAAAEDPDRRGRFLHHRAGELFRETRFAESIRFYDAAVAAGHPHNEDACWERGLAYYYAGDFERGRRQFEGYHKVGPLDIENGIWRLLCTAKTEGLEKAREAFYPYPRKVRPPFPALHALFSGAGSPDAVFEEARSGAKDAELDERVFYAHYYVAKHFEAAGDAAKALQHLEEALRRPVNHFMADCARIDVERVRRTVRGSGGGKG